MLKEKTANNASSSGSSGSFLAELFQVGLYKRTQGKIARRATFGTLAASAAIACYSLYQYLGGYLYNSSLGDNADAAALGIAGGVFALSVWVCFRLVNYARFADFLIAVEAEMNKMSWPSRPVLVRSSLVVIICLVILAGAMWLMDIVWVGVFQATDVLRF